MSRHTLFKKSLEDILDRELFPTEKRLVVALSLIRKAYDDNFLELREKRRIMLKKYGYNSTMRIRKSAVKGIIRASKKKGAMEYTRDVADFQRLLNLENQIFCISKTLRRGVGFELLEREIPKAENPRRETARGSRIRQLMEV